MNRVESHTEISFDDCLRLLSNWKSIRIPLLSIMLVTVQNCNIQECYFTDHKLIIHKKEYHYDNLYSFFLSLNEEMTISSTTEKTWYIIKKDHIRNCLALDKLMPILADENISKSITGFQCCIKYKHILSCTIMLDSNKKYEIVFAQAFPLWIEQRIKYISIKIVELLNIKLKFKQVSKALLIYMIDQHDKIYLADIGEIGRAHV